MEVCTALRGWDGGGVASLTGRCDEGRQRGRLAEVANAHIRAFSPSDIEQGLRRRWTSRTVSDLRAAYARNSADCTKVVSTSDSPRYRPPLSDPVGCDSYRASRLIASTTTWCTSRGMAAGCGARGPHPTSTGSWPVVAASGRGATPGHRDLLITRRSYPTSSGLYQQQQSQIPYLPVLRIRHRRGRSQLHGQLDSQ